MKQHEKHPALELFSRLLSVGSPSGREERLARLVGTILDELGYAFEQDSAGNLTVRIEGSDPSLGKIIYAAHMDEIAMVVSGINPDGSLRVDPSGGLHPSKIRS